MQLISSNQVRTINALLLDGPSRDYDLPADESELVELEKYGIIERMEGMTQIVRVPKDS